MINETLKFHNHKSNLQIINEHSYVRVIQNYYTSMQRGNRQSSGTLPHHYMDKGLTIGEC